MFVEIKASGEVKEAKALSRDAQALLKAADILEREGHLKGALYLEDGGSPTRGPHCVAGAINRALTGSAHWPTPAEHSTTWRLLGRLGHGDWARAIYWNNRNSTQAADVIAALRQAAKEA